MRLDYGVQCVGARRRGGCHCAIRWIHACTSRCVRGQIIVQLRQNVLRRGGIAGRERALERFKIAGDLVANTRASAAGGGVAAGGGWTWGIGQQICQHGGGVGGVPGFQVAFHRSQGIVQWIGRARLMGLARVCDGGIIVRRWETGYSHRGSIYFVCSGRRRVTVHPLSLFSVTLAPGANFRNALHTRISWSSSFPPCISVIAAKTLAALVWYGIWKENTRGAQLKHKRFPHSRLASSAHHWEWTVQAMLFRRNLFAHQSPLAPAVQQFGKKSAIHMG